jgi:signal transduction histidine kinase/ActR/RegA family two-component response regulator
LDAAYRSTRVPDAREVLDALYTFVGVLTTDGVVVETNRAPLLAAGITLDDVRGRPFWDCHWWSYDPGVQARCREACEAAARGESVRFDVTVRMAADRRMPIDFQIAPLRAPDGTITHLIPSGVEITSRHRTEASLREANALLDTIFATAPIGLAFWNRELQFVRVNDRLAEINGIPVAEHIGRRPDELLPGIADVQRLLGQWRELLRTGEPLLGVEIGGTTPASPVQRSWREDFFPVRIDDEIVGLGAVVLETTEQKRQEAQLREADRRKDEFLAMLAHELRNPLGAISNATAVLARFRTEDPQLATIREMLDRQVRHLGRLVDDLLDVARIAQDKLVLRRRRTDVADAVRQAVEANAAAADSRGQRIDVRLPRRELTVDADPARLAQIVSNLVHNAVKFTHEGGRIDVSVGTEDGHAVLAVADDGPGIAPELLGRVFDLFAQGARAGDRQEGGLGIGLTLVQRLVEMHGGTVEARSEGLGHGATFRVRLPLAASDVAVVDEPAPPPPPADAEPLRVLVVDDNADVLTSMTMLLELEGHAVTTAQDAESTFRAVQDFRPDVVLLDLGLPGADGYEVARRLRATLGAQLLLVAVTGYGQPEDRLRSRAAGFDHHLLKPVDFDALQALLAGARRTGDRCSL